MPGTVFDVVASSLHQPGNLAKLRDHSPGALGFGRVRKEGLTGQAAADDLRVDLGIPLPGPDDLQLVHPRFDARRHDRMVHLLDARQVGRIDLVETTAETG